MEFTHYYGRFQRKNLVVVQKTVLQKRKLQCRLSGDHLKRFDDHKKYSGQDESAFIRTLIDEALTAREEKTWQQECKEMFV